MPEECADRLDYGGIWVGAFIWTLDRRRIFRSLYWFWLTDLWFLRYLQKVVIDLSRWTYTLVAMWNKE